MRYDITPETVKLIRASIEDTHGAMREASNLIGITQDALTRILNGERKRVYEETWRKLVEWLPEIAPHSVFAIKKRMKDAETEKSATEVAIAAAAKLPPLMQKDEYLEKLNAFKVNYPKRVLDLLMGTDKLSADVKVVIYNIISEYIAQLNEAASMPEPKKEEPKTASAQTSQPGNPQ